MWDGVVRDIGGIGKSVSKVKTDFDEWGNLASQTFKGLGDTVSDVNTVFNRAGIAADDFWRAVTGRGSFSAVQGDIAEAGKVVSRIESRLGYAGRVAGEISGPYRAGEGLTEQLARAARPPETQGGATVPSLLFPGGKIPTATKTNNIQQTFHISVTMPASSDGAALAKGIRDGLRRDASPLFDTN